MDYKELIDKYRSMARRWENGEQLLLNGELQIQDTLREAATAIKTLLVEQDVAIKVTHGQWEKIKPIHYSCSICGYKVGGMTSNYCPNCGAKMDAKG